MNCIILIFRCRNDALSVRGFLLANNVLAKVIDAPRQLSPSCGLALEVSGYSAANLRTMLGGKFSFVAGMYAIDKRGNKKAYFNL